MADVTAVFWLETTAKMAVPTQHGSLVARWRRLEVGDSAITHFRVCANKYTSGGNMVRGRALLCPTLSAHQICKGVQVFKCV